MDVKTAFLNGDLVESIYMEQPDGYQITNQAHLVCKLWKALYGLKQASRAWYEKMNTFLLSQCYLPFAADANLYYTKLGSVFTFIALYIDDTILVSNDFTFLTKCKANLQSTFEW